MIALRNNRMLRFILLSGVPLVTALILLIGTVTLHVPGFSPLFFAHAMTRQATCVSTRGTQPTLCNQHNPIEQGCTQDARTVEAVFAFDAKNTLIGEVDLRHSQLCNALWVRTITFASAPQVRAVDALLSLNDGNVQDHQRNTRLPDHRLIAFTDMSQPTMLPKTVAGVFYLRGQTQPITILL